MGAVGLMVLMSRSKLTLAWKMKPSLVMRSLGDVMLFEGVSTSRASF